MAKSQSHKLGEQIGNFFEEAMQEPIKQFALKNNLYFDTFGQREARPSKKVTWEDVNGNKHDLDYVLERNGSDTHIGDPMAFIELAWRRYTKHSKNKAQEIYGAVNPIANKYNYLQPFKGAILSGDFTLKSLEQLRSQGFEVLYIPFDTIVRVFKKHNLDIYFDEDTTDIECEKIISRWNRLPKKKLNAVMQTLYQDCEIEIKQFVENLRTAINRRIKHIYILPLHGEGVQKTDVNSAVDFINAYNQNFVTASLEVIHIAVVYNNGTNIEGNFKTKGDAISFLKNIF